MEYKVLSTRVPLSLLAYCYEILELGGINPVGMPMSTAIVTTIEKISISLLQENRLKICRDDQDAQARIAKYINPRGWAGDTISKDARPNYLDSEGPIQTTDIPRGPEDRKQRIEQLLEDAVEKTIAEAGESLSNVVSAPQNDEHIENVKPVSTKSLKDIDMVSDAECICDKMYAEQEDENMKLALRIVYNAIPFELRSTETAYKLAYKIWAEHDEKVNGTI